MPEKVTSIILAGGKNLRLGRNKALEIIGGKKLIRRVFEKLELLSDEIIIVTSWETVDTEFNSEAEVVADIFPMKGPLGGIYTGLMKSHNSINIVVACDMPFLNTGLLRYMVDESGGYDVTVPRMDEGMIEPLHAVYAKRCLEVIDERLDDNRLNIHGFFNSVKVRYIEKEECLKLDPELLSFFNINYQSDLDRAAEIVREKGI